MVGFVNEINTTMQQKGKSDKSSAHDLPTLQVYYKTPETRFM